MLRFSHISLQDSTANVSLYLQVSFGIRINRWSLFWITVHPSSWLACVFQFEGLPTYPDVSRMWGIVDKYQVTKFYTAPTAIRLLMKFGSEPVQKWVWFLSFTLMQWHQAFPHFHYGRKEGKWSDKCRRVLKRLEADVPGLVTKIESKL